MLRAKVQPVPAHRFGRPDMQILNRGDVVWPIDRQHPNDFRCRPYHEAVIGAVGSRGGEQVLKLWPHPLGVAVRHRRKQHELAGRNLETLLANSAFTQQHPLPAVQQRVHHRAPLLERGHRGGLRRRALCHRAGVSRRNGGEVFGGWRRVGNAPSSRVVVAATSATAASKASALADEGWVIPLTFRTYCRAAATISSLVAG